MIEIPEDVMKAAREVANEIAAPPVWGALPLFLPIIARAILAERERCEAEAASLRGLLAEAGKALDYYASPEAWTVEQVEGSYGDYGEKARTVATKIEEALK